MNWGNEDLAAALALLLGAAVCVGLIFRAVPGTRPRIVLIACAVFIVAAIWVDLAAGIWR